MTTATECGATSAVSQRWVVTPLRLILPVRVPLAAASSSWGVVTSMTNSALSRG